MAAKIKDGLFIGDEETSQSEIFINDNKISNLINLSGREVPNVWASHGLVYLTYNWEDRPDYRLFSGHEDSILTDIIEFVDVSIAHGISVLMFSKKGTGRAAVAACLYLMVKYRWGFEKSYDYVYSKKPDIDLNKGFIQQMFALDMKLVASRQKAYALKHGIENTFKIEPNMTINDIAAMLPSTEAKRWNSWDPSYVLTPNSTTTDSRPVTQDNIEEVVTWQKYAEPVVSALRKKDQIVVKVMLNKTKGNLRALDDAEEELVLIFSFINAKNTISTLPGPYYNAYEVQKQFALRFDSVVFEEDVNWFPTSPSSSRYTYAPKGILKGVQRPLLTASSKQPSTSDMSQHKPTSNNNNNAASAGGARDDKHAMSPPHVGLANPRNSIEIRSTKTNTATPPVADDDLLKYVGISAAAQSKDDGNNGHYSNSNNHASAPSNVAPPKRTTPASAAYEDKSANPPANTADYDRKPMTAEERLRKLMADMERQKPASTTSSARSGSNTGTRGSSNSAANDNANAGGGAPSLYDLANMQVHASSAAAAANTGSGGGARGGPTGPSGSSGYGTASGRGGSHGNQDFAMEDFDEDDDLDDPLAAFDVPTSHAASNRGGSSTAAGPGATSSAGGKTGALRARHDILANTTSGVGSTSRTGTNSMTASGGRSSSLNNTTGGSGSRPQAWGTSSSGGGVSNRYASPSSVRSSGTNNVPSSNSSIASQASDARVGSGGGGSGGAYVGSGTTSGTQVYRHGSPAPNNRPATGGLSSSGARRSTTGSGTAAGSGGRVASSSNNSVGSMGSNGLNGVYGTGLGGSSGPSGRFSPAPSPSTAKSTRYSSPFVAGPTSSGSGGGGATGYDSGAAPRGSTPQRRGSNSSINSMGSAGNGSNSGGPVSSSGYGPASSGARRSVGTASPMRASYGGTTSGGTSGSRPASPASFGNTTGGIGTSSSGVPAKRFSTPTPHDYDNSSAGSNRPGSASSAGRNNTPSKASWRF